MCFCYTREGTLIRCPSMHCFMSLESAQFRGLILQAISFVAGVSSANRSSLQLHSLTFSQKEKVGGGRRNWGRVSWLPVHGLPNTGTHLKNSGFRIHSRLLSRLTRFLRMPRTPRFPCGDPTCSRLGLFNRLILKPVVRGLPRSEKYSLFC